jgi:hypothetical protein
MTQSSSPTCTWRPGDAEALRIALSIPVSAPSLTALNREMAMLQAHYPTGVCTAQVNAPVRSRRKGVAGGVVPNPLPLSKLAVVDYATELLLEETESEWNPAGPSPAVVLNRHRSQHIGQLALLLPRLQNWRQCNPDPFQGLLVRG